MAYIVDERKILKTLNKSDKSIRAAYSAWKGIVTNHGLRGVRSVKGFHLEKLKGKREGQYSCLLNRGYRVFFKEIDNNIEIEVLEISKHAY
jgi:Txe/YoeB family toxin of Txe-Axe toxin-antitoxin module